MSLIDSNYFQLDINIAINEYSNVDQFISRYEKRYLIDLLGRELAELVMAYDEVTSGARIKAIVEGSGDWPGLINADKISPIAYHCYIMYQRDTATMHSSVGQVKPKTGNAVMVDASNKAFTASNERNRLEVLLMDYLWANRADYPELVFTPTPELNGHGL